MSEYIIMTDSTVDLPKEYLTEELGVPYIPLTYLIDGQSYEDMIGLTGEEFFAKVRAGSMPTTSQINPEQAREALTVCFSILNPPFRDNLKLRKSGIPEIFYCLDSA